MEFDHKRTIGQQETTTDKIASTLLFGAIIVICFMVLVEKVIYG